MRFKSDAQIDKRRFEHHIEDKMIISVSASLLDGAGHQCRNMCIYFFVALLVGPSDAYECSARQGVKSDA
jgi:hypothetical protein